MSKKLIYYVSAITFIFFIAISSHTKADETGDDFKNGMTSYNLGNYEEALENFRMAIDDDPNDWAAYQEEGYCYYHLNQLDEMKGVFDISLRLHPDNPELKAFIKNLPPPSTPAPTATASASGTTIKDHWNKGVYLKISPLFDYAAMGDFSQSASVFNSEVTQTPGQGSASNSSAGFALSLEPCLFLDPENAIALKVGYSGGHGYQQTFTYEGQTESETFDPQLLTVGFEYFRYFYTPSGRFYLVLAPIIGETLVPVNASDPSETITGTLTGTGLGVEAGLGFEWKISENSGLEVSVRFRGLSITNLESTYQDSLGNTGLAILATDSQGSLGLADPATLNQLGLKAAVADFTGFVLGASYNFCLF